MKQGIEFPILNISINCWTFNNFGELILYDEYYYSNDIAFYKMYNLSNFFADCKGEIFEIVAFKPIRRSLLMKIFSKKRYISVFEPTNKSITFEELRKFLIERILQLDCPEGQKAWLSNIEKAKTIRDLIQGA